MQELRIGVVGCGGIARDILGLFRLTKGVRLIAFMDSDIDRARDLARKAKSSAIYNDYEEMLSSEDLDAVYLAVPHYLHFPLAQTAIERRVHVWLEKPLACTYENGIQLVKLAEERSIKVGVNYQYRYDPGCYALARAVQSGGLGKINYARVNIPWHREEDYFKTSRWHASLDKAGGGTLITQGSHLLDIALWAIGGQPVAVMGMTAKRKYPDIEVEDLAQALVEMDDGVLIQICSAMVASSDQMVTVEIYGDKVTAVYRNKPIPSVKFLDVKLKKEKVPYQGVHAIHRSLKGFRDWVLEDKPYLLPAKECLPVLAVVNAIYRSAKSGCKEQV